VNAPELERRVADVLKERAEAAMNSTETDQVKLDDLLADAERAGRKRRWLWGAGGAIAGAAAAGIVVWAMSLTPGTPAATAPAVQAPTDPVQVATAFVDAYTNYDRPRLRSLVAGQALANWSSRNDSNQGDEAIEFRMLVDHCTAARLSSGSFVTCWFDAHALGSEQLGLGPFPDNYALLTVRDGKVIEWQINFTFGTNGFSDQMWNPFMGWVTQHYPKDVARMIDENSNVLPNATHIAQYIAVMYQRGIAG
jgi:hypothetical protein